MGCCLISHLCFRPNGRVDFRVPVPKYPLQWVVNGISMSRNLGLGIMRRPTTVSWSSRLGGGGVLQPADILSLVWVRWGVSYFLALKDGVNMETTLQMRLAAVCVVCLCVCVFLCACMHDFIYLTGFCMSVMSYLDIQNKISCVFPSMHPAVLLDYIHTPLLAVCFWLTWEIARLCNN